MYTISPSLHNKFKTYIHNFNQTDDELVIQQIPNCEAEAFLLTQIPLIECPNEQLEKIYYFRWWTYRKHIKHTDKGHIITEFLPSVPWAGPYNSIVCPACLHIREGRWLADSDNWIVEYIDFWLNRHGNLFDYSSWLAHALWEYCSLKNDYSIGIQRLPKLVEIYEERERDQQRYCGLYWSDDGRDGGEYSISGPGLRPTLSSYACADALAIANFAEKAEDQMLRERFNTKAEHIRKAMDTLLWDKDFYKTIPVPQQWDMPLIARPNVNTSNNVRELLGYVPWYFNLPGQDKSVAFKQLLDDEGFQAPFGLTSAEQRHPRFMEVHDHECLWNGPVWPFGTSQALVAIANLLRAYPQNVLTKNDYFDILLQYANTHRLITEDGTVLPWIDENLHPYTGQWIAREILKQAGWQDALGGYERGKDYNHSLFCDLILSGLFGIDVKNGELTAEPLIPDDWEYFLVENLHFQGKIYRILYDKTGNHYHCGQGINISCME